MNTTEYDKVAYKKYEAFRYIERRELIEQGCDVDFPKVSFEQFMNEINTNSEFAKVWGYWNFI